MTSNPLTIAGETVTAEDWPEGCPGFECINDPDCGPIWLLRICDPYGRNFYLNYEQREFQQGCRCWHLDEAEKVNWQMSLTPVIDYDNLKRKYDAHIASAAKWARISKGVKT